MEGDRLQKILVVEDDALIRDLIEKVLRGGGYEVVSTGEPLKAVDLARTVQPDLVLCDIAMPGLDGYGVLRGLQNDPTTAHYPVVFLTAHREFSERVRAFRFGVVDYVTKPFSREVLLRKVEKVLQGRHQRPGVVEEPESEGSLKSLMEEVERESRSGVLTVREGGDERHALVEGGHVVESTLGSDLGTPARAAFQELDPLREAIVSHEPRHLPGNAEAPLDFSAVPEEIRTVLVADDKEVFRTFLADVLGKRGFTVYQAGDGEEALRLALEKRPWLILTDVAMPKMDGIEFCQRVRGHSLIRHTPLIFLSGWDDYKDRYRGLEAGADEYLSKDTPVRELLIRIQIVMRRYADLGARAWRGPSVEGRLEVMGTLGLLQMCHLSRLSGVCTLASAGRRTEIVFRNGEILAAGGGNLSGAEAIYDLLSWTDGQFSFVPGNPGEGKPLEQGLEELMLEGCRRLDEKKRLSNPFAD